MSTLTINGLASATNLDRRTIRKRLVDAGLFEGRDTWALAEALPILFAPPEPEQFAKNRDLLVQQQTRRLELANEQTERSMIPCVLVERVINSVLAGLAQKISFLEIPPHSKQSILEDLQSIPIDDYFTTALREIEADEAEPT